MRQSIRGYTDGLIELARAGRPPGLAELASELTAVSGVFDTSDDLRRALGDPGVPAPQRRAVIEDLFGSRLSPIAVRLLSFVVDADRASEVPADIAWLAGRLRATADNMEPASDTVLGHRSAEERLDGYATAVLEAVPGRRQLGEIEDELFRFHRIVSGSDELRAALSDKDVPASARRNLVNDLLRSKASPATVALAAYPTKVGRPRDYEELLGGVVARVALETDRRLAEVRSAVELNDSQREQLAGALSRAVGQQVEVRVTVDPSVVAGFVATVGDTVVDASARHQLEILRDRLVNPEAVQTNTHGTGERP